jgi:hypothetical protein
VTIFHQANKGKSIVFIAMIHLMRYIYFCFDVILYHLLGLMTQDRYHISVLMCDVPLDILYILYISFIFIFM